MFESMFGLNDDASKGKYNYDSSDDNYIVIQRGDLNKLVIEVSKLMRNGWQPQGGISGFEYTKDNWTYRSYLQAMIRK